jgi:hypothetical protein
LTLEEAIQTFDEKEESIMFSLKFKQPPNVLDVEPSEKPKDKIIRLRKQTIEIEGVP